MYARIDQDMEELDRLDKLPEDQRGEDYEVLSRYVDGYRQAVGKVEDELRAKRRETLEQKDMDELVDIVRKERMDNNSAEAYLNAYQLWQWFACTYKRRGHDERVFKDFNQMKLNTPTDVIEALRETFNDLESRLSRGAAGNS
jgi:predicted nucleic acid-binding protein